MRALALAALISYLAGSIPFSYIAGKLFKGIDIRRHGSGNAGASNTVRVMGAGAGAAVLLLDFAKGFLAVHLIPQFISGVFFSGPSVEHLKLIVMASAVTGHIFPVYICFRGGKGVSAAAGCVTALYLPAFFLCIIVFAAVFYKTRIASAASLSAVWALPLFYPALALLFQPFYLSREMLFILCSLLITFRHRSNISRLLDKKEESLDF